MRRDISSAVVAVVILTLLLGVAYPLVVTGLAQVAFPGAANGSRAALDGRLVGSRLIGQGFEGDPRYFQSRPSATRYAAAATAFSNAGPNAKRLRRELRARAASYLRRERRYDPRLTLGDVPPDAVMSSASGVDPDISPANARIQARRVAGVRGLSRRRVAALVERYTDARDLGFLGEPGVNVLELNLALDRQAPR